jgi:SAM-dependent methyltransferase
VRYGDDVLEALVERSSHNAGAALKFGAFASARQYSLLYRLWRRHVPNEIQVLDWGAGNGHFGYFLKETGATTTAFTFQTADEMDWVGRPYDRIEFGSPADPIRLPFPDGSFDAVASVGVLEHVRETGGNEAASLAELARVLRPGGTFVCYHLPNQRSWIESTARLISGKHHHRFRFFEPEIRRLLRDAGLEILELHRYGLLPRNQLRRLPHALRRSWAFANLWDAADATLGRVVGPISQNYAFVARKP